MSIAMKISEIATVYYEQMFRARNMEEINSSFRAAIHYARAAGIAHAVGMLYESDEPRRVWFNLSVDASSKAREVLDDIADDFRKRMV
jgi:formylmethanofuran dehydrogenase subunit A